AYSSDLYRGNFKEAFSGKTVKNYMAGIMFAEGIAKPVLGKMTGFSSKVYRDDPNLQQGLTWKNEFKKWGKQTFVDSSVIRPDAALSSSVTRSKNNKIFTGSRIGVSRI